LLCFPSSSVPPLSFTLFYSMGSQIFRGALSLLRSFSRATKLSFFLPLFLHELRQPHCAAGEMLRHSPVSVVCGPVLFFPSVSPSCSKIFDFPSFTRLILSRDNPLVFFPPPFWSRLIVTCKSPCLLSTTREVILERINLSDLMFWSQIHPFFTNRSAN